MPDSPVPTLQTFQGILTTNDYVSLPVQNHQPTGIRYIPMNVLRNIYPGIVRLQVQVDGQIIKPRRGFPTVQSMFEGVFSQWVDESSLVMEDGENDEDESSNDNSTTPGTATSEGSYVHVSSQGDWSTAAGGSSPVQGRSSSSTSSSQGINPTALISGHGSIILPDDDNSDSIEWIEYQPNRTIQVIHHNPAPTGSPGSSSGAGSGSAHSEFPPSYWARIRQEIHAVVRQIRLDMLHELQQEQEQERGQSSTSSSPSSYSWLASPTTNQLIEQRIITRLLSEEQAAVGSSGIDEDITTSGLRKRDRDEDDDDDAQSSSATSSGSEKRLRPSGELAPALAPSTPSEPSLDVEISDTGTSDADSSGQESSSSESTSSESSAGQGSPESGSPGEGGAGSSGQGSTSSESSPRKGSQKSESPGGSGALSTSGSESPVGGAGESPVYEHAGEDPSFTEAQSDDEFDEDDLVMITSDPENQPTSDHHDEEDENDEEEEEDGQPFRFTDHQLRDFVKKKQGLLVNDSQAITISLKTSQEALKFYKFLTSPDYFGRWLSIKLTWDWDRDELAKLADAVSASSTIETLYLDGCCVRAPATATSTTTIVTSGSSSTSAVDTLVAESQPVDHQDDSRPSRKYDPLIRLFRSKTLTELHFYGLHNLFLHSKSPIPWSVSLSHLRSFHLHAKITDTEWNGYQAVRFLQFVQRATNLEHLLIDSPLPDRYNTYMTEIRRSLDKSERTQDSPLLDISFQYHRNTVLRTRYDTWDRVFKEFEVDLTGTGTSFNVEWQSVLTQQADATLTRLSLSNMRDETWMETVMDWARDWCTDRGLGLLNLQLDCLHLGPSQLWDLLELIHMTDLRLQTLDLRNLYLSPASNAITSTTSSSATTETPERITWPSLVQALNISVLQSLHIKNSNLQDRDIRDLTSCLGTMVRGKKKLALEKLALQGAQMTFNGKRALVDQVRALLPGVDIKFR